MQSATPARITGPRSILPGLCAGLQVFVRGTPVQLLKLLEADRKLRTETWRCLLLFVEPREVLIVFRKKDRLTQVCD